MKSLLLFLLTLVSCAPLQDRTAARAIELPEPFEAHSVQVRVDGLYERGLAYVGVDGVAENVGDRELAHVSVQFDVVDEQGVKVADAFALTQSLAPGQRWRFQALFLSPFGASFRAITNGRVSTLSSAVGSSLAAAQDAVDQLATDRASAAGGRRLGIVSETRMPDGRHVARVDRLSSGQLAEQAGFLLGDLVTAIDGEPVESMEELIELTRRGAPTKTYTVLRRGQLLDLVVEFER